MGTPAPEVAGLEALEALLERARSGGKLLVVCVVRDGEPRSLDGVLDGPVERAFVARHVLLAVLGESDARALGDKAIPGTLHAVHTSMARPMGSRPVEGGAGGEVLNWLRFMRTLCAFDHRRDARERRSEDAGAGCRDTDRQIQAELADGGGRTAFRYRGGFRLEDASRARVSALAEMARKDPQLALELGEHASELEAHVFLDAADGGDVHTWIAILEATSAFERMLLVVERLRRDSARAQLTTVAAIAAHTALARAARWHDLLRLHPDPLDAVAGELALARAVRRSSNRSAPWGGSRSTRITGEQIYRRAHELYSALLSTRRDTEAESVARLVLEAEPTASNHLGLVHAGLRVGRRSPIFEEWLQYAASHGEREDAKRAAWLREELDLLPPD